MIKVEIDVIIMSKTTQVNIYVYVDVFLGSLGVIFNVSLRQKEAIWSVQT